MNDSKAKLLRWLDFDSRGDSRGQLVAIESHKNIPFDIKRAYYLLYTKAGVSRGFHAHRDLQQVAICVSGRCRMVLDDGKVRQETWMDSPSRGVYIGQMVWREMHDFSENCVLLVLASEHYDEADYIRDYAQFLEAATRA